MWMNLLRMSFLVRYFTFICGRAGIYALGAAAAKYAENNDMMHYFLKPLREVCAIESYMLMLEQPLP